MTPVRAALVLLVVASLVSLNLTRTQLHAVSSEFSSDEGESLPVILRNRKNDEPPESQKDSSNVSDSHIFSTRPHFVLHLGPGKTGTTSLQCTLTRMFGERLLEQDNYLYLGRMIEECSCINTTLHSNCPQHEKTDFLHPQSCHSQRRCQRLGLRSYLTQQHAKGINLVVSHEGYSGLASRAKDAVAVRGFFQHLSNYLVDWDAEFVLMYRRFFEWLLSAKHEQDSGLDREWPGIQGSRKILPVWESMQRLIHHDFSRLRHQYTGKVIERIGDVVRLRILNVHQKDSVRQFLCDVLRAPNTCNHYGLEELPPVHETTDRSYDCISVAAYERNLLRSSLKRLHVNQLVRQRQARLAKSGQDFPWICPSTEELNELLQRSLEYEKQIVPDYYYASGKQLHEEAFWKAAASNKFCTVDANQVLEDQDWVDFFQTL